MLRLILRQIQLDGTRRPEVTYSRALSTILYVDSTLEYVTSGRRVPSSWIWRKLGRDAGREPEPAGQVRSG